MREDGYETIMVNCNPETVSTDYDTSDRLYFEPLTKEDVLNIIDAEQPYKVIVSLGGQTPLKLAGEIPLELVAGTSPDSIDAAEDRDEPFTFQLDRGKVILGWEYGMLMMREGEIRLIIVPFEMGYGTRGRAPDIPRMATLIFEVEMLKVTPRD